MLSFCKEILKEAFPLNDAALLGTLATWALLWEVSAAPKPGLVDRRGSGAHDDMDMGTFLRSAQALAPHWALQARTGLEVEDPLAAMELLRRRGRTMEEEMLRATGGVNTHRGLVFALSLILWGAGRLLARQEIPRGPAVAREASRLVEGCVARELEPLKKNPPARRLSHGERLYLLHGVTGIRGEAEGGFPSIVTSGLPTLTLSLAEGASLEEALIDALLALMERCEDSNVIHRGGFALWQERYLPLVGQFRRSHGRWDDSKRQALKRLDDLFRRERISPGGAADLLACTLFLHVVERISLGTSCQQ